MQTTVQLSVISLSIQSQTKTSLKFPPGTCLILLLVLHLYQALRDKLKKDASAFKFQKTAAFHVQKITVSSMSPFVCFLSLNTATTKEEHWYTCFWHVNEDCPYLTWRPDSCAMRSLFLAHCPWICHQWWSTLERLTQIEQSIRKDKTGLFQK